MIESQKNFKGRDVFKTMTLHGIYCILVQGKEDVNVISLLSNANTTIGRKNEKWEMRKWQVLRKQQYFLA